MNTHDDGDALNGERPLKDPVVARLILRLGEGVAGDAEAGGSGAFTPRLPGLSDKQRVSIVYHDWCFDGCNQWSASDYDRVDEWSLKSSYGESGVNEWRAQFHTSTARGHQWNK